MSTERDKSCIIYNWMKKLNARKVAILTKNEFNHDMDELGKAFRDLTVENIK